MLLNKQTNKVQLLWLIAAVGLSGCGGGGGSSSSSSKVEFRQYGLNESLVPLDSGAAVLSATVSVDPAINNGTMGFFWLVKGAGIYHVSGYLSDNTIQCGSQHAVSLDLDQIPKSAYVIMQACGALDIGTDKCATVAIPVILR